jgi:hypothetical protein
MSATGSRILRVPVTLVWMLITVVCVRAQLPPDRSATDRAFRSQRLDLSLRFLGDALAQATPPVPRALVAADLDSDGMAELICGYGAGAGGALTIHRGNLESVFPALAADRGRTAAGRAEIVPFSPKPLVEPLEMYPDLLAVGDLDADTVPDIVIASPGADRIELFNLTPDGALKKSRSVKLKGGVTALAIGEVNRRDGLPDLVVAIDTPAGAQLLVYEGPFGAIKRAPEVFDLPAPATALALGNLDEDWLPDIAVACGAELILIRGRDRKLSLDAERRASVAPARIDRNALPAPVADMVAANLIWDDRRSMDLGLLMASGDVALIRPTAAGAQYIPLGDKQPALTGIANGRIIRSRSLAQPQDDLVILNPALGEAIVYNFDANKLERIAAPGVTGVARARLSPDTLDDLVLLGDGDNPITIHTPAPIAVITVNSNGSATTNDEFMTLQQAIKILNEGTNQFTTTEELAQISGTPGGDGLHEIHFDDVPSGLSVITLSNGTNITRPVFIDGDSHPDFGPGALPNVVLQGSYNVLGGSSLIRSIVQNTGQITLDDRPGDTIEGCLIGTDEFGELSGANGTDLILSPNTTLAGPQDPITNHQIGDSFIFSRNIFGQRIVVLENANQNLIINNNCGLTPQRNVIVEDQPRILVESSSDNTIGWPGLSGANVVVGSVRQGVYVHRRAVGALVPESNLIQNNLVGIDDAGNGGGTFGNKFTGIELNQVGMTTIGGSMEQLRNVVSGNSFGIIARQGNQVLVQGNLVGLNPFAGPTSPTLANDNDGIVLDTCSNSAVGGIVPMEQREGSLLGPFGDPPIGMPPGNVVCGNGRDGVSFASATTTSTMQGNLIGVLLDGSPAGNGGDGFEMSLSGQGNLIGGLVSGARNIVSNNGFRVGQAGILSGNGMRIRGQNVANNRIQGNFIGTDPSGLLDHGNNQDAILIQEAAHDNLIGGDTTDATNIIAAAGSFTERAHGVHIRGPGSHRNVVAGNLIGVDRLILNAFGHSGFGVYIEDRVTSNVVGGVLGNFISGNGGFGFESGGVAIDGAGLTGTNVTQGNEVLNNFIGIGIDGLPLPNFGHGVIVRNDARRNVIGRPGMGNLISGNGGLVFDANGIHLASETRENVIQSNLIGTDDLGTTAVANSLHGILIEDSGFNTIGGLQPGQPNVISGNTSCGLVLRDPFSDKNTVAGNLIGVGADGKTPIGNGFHGVLIAAGAEDNTVGPGNTIAQNGEIFLGGAGVAMTGDADGNLITANSIFANADIAIDLAADGPTANDQFDNDANGSANAGPNDLQNYPEVTAATSISAEGTLHGIPNRKFRIEVFAGAEAHFFFGTGEAETYLGSVTDVMTNGSGNAVWSIGTIVVPSGQPYISATATDVTEFGTPPNTLVINNTSEVSASIMATGVPTLDFGDAPDPTYPTLFAGDGARHQILQNFFLGEGVDSDADGQPNDQASGDDDNGDDEDGVVFPADLVLGRTVILDIQASLAGGLGFLDAFIDFNADGDWEDEGEKVFDAVALNEGLNQLELPIPPDATAGPTYARFRLSADGGHSFNGLVASGEVEDYRIELREDNVQQPIDRLLEFLNGGDGGNLEELDLNGDDVVNVADLVTAINLKNGAINRLNENTPPDASIDAVRQMLGTDAPALQE